MKLKQLLRIKGITLVKFILAAFAGLVVAIGLSHNLLSTSRTEPVSTLISREQSASLFIIKSSGKWGYINRTGKVIISPQFEEAGDFNEGLAAVKVGKESNYKVGYIDPSGKFIIQPQFSDASDFSDGLASVSIDGKSGYIDRTGKVVISPRFSRAEPFKNGVASVNENGNAYINATGKIIVKDGDFDYVSDFSEGLTAVEQGKKHGYVDSSGKVIIPLQFTSAGSFHEGLAGVEIKGKYGFINRTGKLVISPKFDGIWEFKNGLCLVRINNERGFINRQGAYVLAPRRTPYSALRDNLAPFSRDIHDFSEGLAAFLGKNNRWGYMDITGKPAIQPRFSAANPFKDGLAKIKTGNDWGYIDRTGKIIIKPQFNEGDYTAEYKDGLIAIRQGRLVPGNMSLVWKTGYLDRNGKYVWQLSE